MAFKLADLLFRISADTKKFDRGMGKSKKKVNTMTRAVGQFKTMLIGAFSIRLVSGFFKKIIDLNKTFEKTMSGVRAISGATGKEFKQLEDSAKELGSTTSRTASQVAELQTEYAKLGFSTKEILAASRATIQLSEATDENLAQAAESAGAAIRAFGLDAKKTQMVVDVMAASFTSSALNLERWTESMGYVAPIAKAAGRSIQLTAAALAIMADAGIHGSRAGTALKRIFEETADSGKPFAESLRDLAEKGITLANAEDEVGRRAMAALLILADNVDKLEELKIAYDNAAGSAQTMADIRMDNLEGSTLRLTSAIEGLVLQAKQANIALKKTIDFFVDILNVQARFVKEGFNLSDILLAPGRTAEWLKLETAFKKILIKWESEGKLTEERINAFRLKLLEEFGINAMRLWQRMGRDHYQAYIDGMSEVKVPALAPRIKVPGRIPGILPTPQVKEKGEIDPFGLADMTNAFKQNVDALREATQRYNDAMTPIIQMNDVIRQSFVDLGVSIGEGIGDMLTGLFKAEDVFRTMLKSVANFAGQFGKLLLAIGIAENAFLKSFNPGQKIAAGIALIALSRVAMNLLTAPKDTGAGTTGGGGGLFQKYAPNVQELYISSVLKGEDIYLSNKRTAERYQRLGTGG